MELLAIALLFIIPAFAQSNTSFDVPQDIGVTPDNPLYFFDILLDNIRYNQAKTESEKAKIGLEIAEERLLEVKAMLNKNDISDAEKAQKEHDKALKNVETDIEDNNARTEQDVEKKLDSTIDLEQRLSLHKSKVDEVKEKVKLRLESNLRRLQTNDNANLEKISSGLENAIERVDIKIDNEKTRIKIRLTDEFDKSEFQVNSKIADLERIHGDKVKAEISNSGKSSYGSSHSSGSERSGSNSGTG